MALKVREGTYRLMVITVVSLGSYFGAHKYCVISLALKHQKESREKNCSAFHFWPSELIVRRDSHFLIVHTSPA